MGKIFKEEKRCRKRYKPPPAPQETDFPTLAFHPEKYASKTDSHQKASQPTLRENSYPRARGQQPPYRNTVTYNNLEPRPTASKLSSAPNTETNSNQPVQGLAATNPFRQETPVSCWKCKQEEHIQTKCQHP